MLKTRWIALVFLLTGSLAGCATYSARPLSTQSTLPNRIPDLTIDPRQMPLPELAAHKFDPTDGLDITEVAMLAVVNNPDLKIARAAAGVVHAQAFAAGLLPDPQLAFSLDIPDAGQTAAANAFNPERATFSAALYFSQPDRPGNTATRADVCSVRSADAGAGWRMRRANSSAMVL